MAKKTGLGRGLDALIVNKVADPNNNISPEQLKNPSMVDIKKVEPNKDQPRKTFDEDALNELADSIKQYGIIEPLIVQDKKDYYRIVAGERRWRAAKIAGLTEVPVIIRDLTDQEAIEIAIIENLQRENLDPIEEAMALKRLVEEFNLKQEEVAERVSKSRAAISNSMRLLKLNEKVQEMLKERKLSAGQARALLAIEDPQEQINIAERIFDEGLNVREVEKLIKSLGKPKKPKKGSSGESSQLESVYQGLEDRMKNALGTKVTINAKDEKTGSIIIEYYSPEELDTLVDELSMIKR